MTLNLHPDAENQLIEGSIAERQLLEVQLGSGTYRFWDGDGPLEYPVSSGNIWQPGAGLILQNELTRSNSQEVESVELVLRAIPDTDLTPDVLGSIFSEEWYQRPVQLSALYFHPDTFASLGDAVVKFTGRIDTIDYEEDSSGNAELKVVCESFLIDITKRNFEMASHDHQQEVFPGDFGFEHVDDQTPQPWGRKTNA